jgi:ribosome biogenesis GTPase
MDLKALGWNAFFEKSFNEVKTKDSFPARLVTAQREIYQLISEQGVFRAEMTGKLRFDSSAVTGLPAVGDWVAARMAPGSKLATIEGVLPRINKFSRKVIGNITVEQVLVANIDIIFLINGLDGDYNPRRIERYLSLIKESNAKPVIILNKTDACPDVAEKIKEVESLAPGLPIHAMSALNGQGIESLNQYISIGTTIAFLGSSGSGKSTIINRLLGAEKQKTGSVHASNSRGKHITTHRELIVLPRGGIVIDNPGLREIQVWANETVLESSFTDILELASGCKFSDCRHMNEPGCAVKRAVETGALDARRLESYIKLKKELKDLAIRKAKVSAINEKIITKRRVNAAAHQPEDKASERGYRKRK